MLGGGVRSAFGRLLGRAGRFASHRGGIAAVEFALIAPLLFCMYFLTLEASQAIVTDKKVARIGSMVADLITQQATIAKSELDAIMQIGNSIIQPYGRSNPKIVVTAIEITPDPGSKVQVAWSRKLVEGVASADAAKGSITTVPTSLNVKGSFLIRVESSLSYKPLITWTATQKQSLGLFAAFDSINMTETYYLRPRMSSTVTCSDC
jgi:Flp pilus assembly protein TadG